MALEIGDSEWKDHLWTEEYYTSLHKKYREKLFLYFRDMKISQVEKEILPFFQGQIPQNERKILFYFYWIQSKEVTTFFNNFPLFLRNIPSETSNVEYTGKSKITGNVIWPKTLRYRMSHGNLLGNNTFIMTNVEKSTITLELKIILKLLFQLEKIITVLIETSKLGKYLDEFLSTKNRIQKWLKHHIFTSVPLLSNTKDIEMHRNRLLKSSNSFVRLSTKILLDFYKTSDNGFQFHSKIVPGPSTNDRLFEIYTLFEILSELTEKHKFHFEKLNLISHLKKSEDYSLVAILNHPVRKQRIKIFYQNTRFLDNSFTDLLKNFQIGSHFFLDLFLEVYDTSTPNLDLVKTVIIEVKRTKESSTIKNGLSQVMNYAHVLKPIKIPKNSYENVAGIVFSWDFEKSPKLTTVKYRECTYKICSYKDLEKGKQILENII
jgi:hypothetical protein